MARAVGRGPRSVLGTALISAGSSPGGPALAAAVADPGVRPPLGTWRWCSDRGAAVLGRADTDRAGAGTGGAPESTAGRTGRSLATGARAPADSCAPRDFPTAAVADAVGDVVARAVPSWPLLGRAVPASGSPDLLLPTMAAGGGSGRPGRRVDGAWVCCPGRGRGCGRRCGGGAEPGTEAVDSGRRLGSEQLADVNWEMIADDNPGRRGADAPDCLRPGPAGGQWVRADSGAAPGGTLLTARKGAAHCTGRSRRLMSRGGDIEVDAPTTMGWIPSSSSIRIDLPEFRATTSVPARCVRWLTRSREPGPARFADDMGLGKHAGARSRRSRQARA